MRAGRFFFLGPFSFSDIQKVFTLMPNDLQQNFTALPLLLFALFTLPFFSLTSSFISYIIFLDEGGSGRPRERQVGAMLTLDKIYHSSYVLKNVARKTDLIAAPNLSGDSRLYLKTENLQVSGSFKLRGAYYKISQLPAPAKAKGVVAGSAGNHAQAVAYSAAKLGLKCVICLPDTTNLAKVENVKALGAEVLLVPGSVADAETKAASLALEKGLALIPACDDEAIIAGHGALGLEILEQLPSVEAVVLPVGGGGLAAALGFTMKSLRPELKVYGVQAAGADAMARSFKAKKYLTSAKVDTFADAIACPAAGKLPFELIQKYVDDIVTVSEDEIATAILALIEKQKLIAEGAGAAPVAAALFGKLPLAGKKTVCLISGGNIEVDILSRVITRGQVTSGRRTNLMIALEDKPGQLTRVSEIVSQCGANVISVYHDRGDVNMAITSCFLKLGLETRNEAQIKEIRAKLLEEGFQLVSERA